MSTPPVLSESAAEEEEVGVVEKVEEKSDDVGVCDDVALAPPLLLSVEDMVAG